MTNQKRTIFFILFLVVFTKAFGQNTAWKAQTSKIRNTEVKSFISKQPNPNGVKVQTMEYLATTIADAKLESCIEVMKNTSLHTKIFDYTKSSETKADRKRY